MQVFALLRKNPCWKSLSVLDDVRWVTMLGSPRLALALVGWASVAPWTLLACAQLYCWYEELESVCLGCQFGGCQYGEGCPCEQVVLVLQVQEVCYDEAHVSAGLVSFYL